MPSLSAPARRSRDIRNCTDQNMLARASKLFTDVAPAGSKPAFIRGFKKSTKRCKNENVPVLLAVGPEEEF